VARGGRIESTHDDKVMSTSAVSRAVSVMAP
jgi:hypothetical protein